MPNKLNLSKDKVCIVSYSKSMEDSNLGKHINSFDKVVRINNGINILDKKDLGSKCDMFACSFFGGKVALIEACYERLNKKKLSIYEILSKKKTEVIFVFTNNKSHYDNDEFTKNKEKFNIIITNQENPIIYYMITTGLCTIITILQAKPKELFVCGFDFTMYLYRGYDDLYRIYGGKFVERLNKTYEEYQDLYHSTVFEKYILKKLWKKFNFTMDENMVKMLEELDISDMDNRLFQKILKGKLFQDTYINYYNDIIKIIESPL